MKFSEILKACRLRKKIKSSSMAQLLGLTETRSYLYYEKGQTEPDPEGLILLAVHLDVTVDYLLGRSDDCTIPQELQGTITFDLGRSLRELRKAKNLNQKSVADHIGLGVRAYGYYEQNTNKPGLAGLVELADFFGVSVDRLLGRGLPEEGPQPRRRKRGTRFPESLQKLLEARGTDKRKIASWLKISVRALDGIIFGRKRPDPETLVDLADYFDITLDELFGREP